LQVDLTSQLAVKEFFLLLRYTHNKLVALDEEYTHHIQNLFVKNDEGNQVFNLSQEYLLDFGRIYFQTSNEQEVISRLESFILIANRCIFFDKQIEAKKNKLFSDIFRLLRTECGKNLLSDIVNQLIASNSEIQFVHAQNRILYYPQVRAHIQERDKRIQDLIEIQKREQKQLTMSDSLEAIRKLIRENKESFMFEIRQGFPFQILISSDLITTKITVSQSGKASEALPCLSYCQRFISLFHELVHVVRTMNGSFYKDVPLVALPLIKVTYDTVEELYAIKLEEKYNENLLRIQLGYHERLTHMGNARKNDDLQGFLESIDTEHWMDDKLQTTLRSLKKSLVAAAIELNQIKIDNLEDPAFNFDNVIETEYEKYKILLLGKEPLPSSNLRF
jgi:hypothetical protein